MEKRRSYNRLAAVSLAALLGLCGYFSSGLIQQPTADTRTTSLPIATIHSLPVPVPTATFSLVSSPTPVPSSTPTVDEIDPVSERQHPTSTLADTVTPLATIAATSTPSANPLPTKKPSTPTSVPDHVTYPEGSLDIVDVLYNQETKPENIKISRPELFQAVDDKLARDMVVALITVNGTLWEKPNAPIDISTEEIIICGRAKHINDRIKPPVCGQIYITHDTFAPRNKLEQQKQHQPSPKESTLGFTNKIGGANLVELQVADITGLLPNYHLIAQSQVIKNVVDDVFHGVIINNPTALNLDQIKVDGVEYEAIHIPAGRVPLNGLHALQLVLGHRMGEHDPTKENQLSIAILLQALMAKLKNTKDFDQDQRVITYAFQALSNPNSKGFEFHPNPLSIITPALLQWGRNMSGDLVVPELAPPLYLGVGEANGLAEVWTAFSDSPDVQSMLKDGQLTPSMTVPKSYTKDGRLVPIVIKTPPQFHRDVLWPSTREAVRQYILTYLN